MKLLINISEQEYNECKNRFNMIYQEGYLNYNLNTELVMCVANGTIIPKGHGDLIDSDKMIKELNERIQIFDERRNEIHKQLDRPEENNQIPLWLWKGCCETCGIIIEADKENKGGTKNE